MCSLEFADHQPLYNWFIEQLGIFPSQQIEFDRLSLTYTLMSKRKLRQLVEQGTVRGWDDPRMPTLSGLRRRGYTPEAIRNFVTAAGVSRTNGIVELAMLEHFVREDLNKRAPRVMAVLRPLKVVIDNYPEGQVEEMDAINNPEDASAGTRKVPFSRVLYIEQDDFREVPPPKYFRLSPGREVRLRYGYFITCTERGEERQGRSRRSALHLRSRNARRQRSRRPQGEVHDPLGLGAARRRCRSAHLRKPVHQRKSWLTWKRARTSLDYLNPNSLEVIPHAKLEPSLANASAGQPLSVRAPGIFLRRSRFKAGNAGVQPHRRAEGYLGKGGEETRREIASPGIAAGSLGVLLPFRKT